MLDDLGTLYIKKLDQMQNVIAVIILLLNKIETDILYMQNPFSQFMRLWYLSHILSMYVYVQLLSEVRYLNFVHSLIYDPDFCLQAAKSGKTAWMCGLVLPFHLRPCLCCWHMK